jgi:hypothetical protein
MPKQTSKLDFTPFFLFLLCFLFFLHFFLGGIDLIVKTGRTALF